VHPVAGSFRPDEQRDDTAPKQEGSMRIISQATAFFVERHEELHLIVHIVEHFVH